MPTPNFSLLNQGESSKLDVKPYSPNLSLLGGSMSKEQSYTIAETPEDKQNFFDSLPLVFKQAYNQSIGGMMYEITHGKKRFNLMDAPESMVRDVAAGIFSFFASPADFAITVGTAGTGSVLAKAGTKAAFGLAGRKGIEKTAISRAGICLLYTSPSPRDS